VGALVPLVAFVLPWLAGRSPESALGATVWSAVAFAGVLLTAFPRTHRLGVGILIGFAGLVVVGAGTCTAAFLTVAG
jgi:hypothetical protein